MAKKYSIYEGAPLAAALEGHDENRSGRINLIAERYLAILVADCPVLSEREWSAIVDANNGTFFGLGNSSLDPIVWANVEDSAPDGLGEKWRIDLPALVAKLRALSRGGTMAVVEVIERFWQQSGDGNQRTIADTLRRAGARLEGDPPRRAARTIEPSKATGKKKRS